MATPFERIRPVAGISESHPGSRYVAWMTSIDVVLAMLRFTVYLLALLQHPHKRRQLALGGIAGAVAMCAMIYLG
jgi:hypothetical protein